jgi:hypothetical protein
MDTAKLTDFGLSAKVDDTGGVWGRVFLWFSFQLNVSSFHLG